MVDQQRVKCEYSVPQAQMIHLESKFTIKYKGSLTYEYIVPELHLILRRWPGL